MGVRVLVIGSGGREHAICRALRPAEVHCAPGNAGIGEVARLHDVSPLDGDAVAALARDLAADLVVIGPEAPLVAGVADAVRAAGIPCFGPSREPAAIEGSKSFAKSVMEAAGVPTARAFSCTTPEEAADALDAFGAPYVVKDDGLAAGKGVVVTSDRAAALAHAAACERVVIEEYLDGPEVSLFALCDGKTAVALQPAQDFKRAYDGDEGPNTGGMGAYTPGLGPRGPGRRGHGDRGRPDRQRAGPPRHALHRRPLRRSRPHQQGPQGHRVQRALRRPGDPGRPRPPGDPRRPAAGRRHRRARLAAPVLSRPGAAVTVVIAAENYPDTPAKGDVIHGLESEVEGAYVIHAGTAFNDGRVVSNGGRVLNVVGTGETVAEARAKAYELVGRIEMRGSFHRGDIAAGR